MDARPDPHAVGSLLLPATDTAVVVEALVVFSSLAVAGIVSRRDRDIRMFVFGLFVFTVAFFGVRSLH